MLQPEALGQGPTGLRRPPGLWESLGSWRSPASASVLTLSGVSYCLSLTRTLVTGFRAHSDNPRDACLQPSPNQICSGPFSKLGHHHMFGRLRHGHLSGGHHSTTDTSQVIRWGALNNSWEGEAGPGAHAGPGLSCRRDRMAPRPEGCRSRHTSGTGPRRPLCLFPWEEQGSALGNVPGVRRQLGAWSWAGREAVWVCRCLASQSPSPPPSVTQG